MARLLLGVSGGIAAYRALELARLATLAGHGVRVIMTANAKRFVGPASFEAITGAPVLESEFEPDPMRGRYPGDEGAAGHDPISHLELAARADAYLVAPATANTIAKLANGHADSLLTTTFLAYDGPRIVAPAMNDRMWADPATAANVATLQARGVQVIEPAEGNLASRGEHGKGRLASPDTLLDAFEQAASAARDLEGVSVLVSAGGTREPIDSVRYIGNRSSGRMGVAIAEEARKRGADVTLVAANLQVPVPAGVTVVEVETAAEMKAALEESFDRADVLVMAAAVSDYTPAGSQTGKIERGDELTLNLQATDDIVASLAARRRPGQVIVGFAAEHGLAAIERASAKVRRKGLDLIAVNDVSDTSIGFDSPQNELTLVSSDPETPPDPLGRAPKTELAALLWDRIANRRRTT